ncbi:MAG: hypothetical protein QMB94_10970 [Phycisphaerales bacterium]
MSSDRHGDLVSQGITVASDDPERLRLILDQAFDDRGDVTVV